MASIIRFIKEGLVSVVALDEVGGRQVWQVVRGEVIGSSGNKTWSHNPGTRRISLMESFMTTATIAATMEGVSAMPIPQGGGGTGFVHSSPNPAFRGVVRWSPLMRPIIARTSRYRSQSCSPAGGGGMTQIDPPSLQLDAGPADQTIDSVVDDLEGIVVLC